MAYQINKKLTAGISFQPNLLALADALVEKDYTLNSRSDYVNRLIYEDAMRKGIDPSTYAPQDASDQTQNPKQAA